MSKIASNHEFQTEVHRLLASCQGPELPSRDKLAADLNALADRVAGGSRPKSLSKLEKDAKRAYKDISALVTQAAYIERENIVPHDEIQKAFSALSTSQQALDDAVDAIGRM